jgi:hypothetical protein
MKSNLNKNMRYRKENVKLRQDVVFELHCLGYNQRDIAKKLNVSLGLVNADLKIMLARSQNTVSDYNKRLPQEVDRAFSVYNVLIREAHNTVETTRDENVKLKAIDSIRDTTTARVQLASNFDIIKHVPNLNKKDDSSSESAENLQIDDVPANEENQK